jgi:HEPN domain-containing protein
VTKGRRGGQTRASSAGEAQAYLTKASEFCRAAEDAMERGDVNAATVSAVHAGSMASDAIAARRAGLVWKSAHAEAAGHLEREAGADGLRASGHLRRLLTFKNRAEYDPEPVTSRDAQSAVTAAGRLVDIAERVLAGG